MKVGTFCAVINKRLAVVSCPLPKGVCVYKHSTTGVCKFDPNSSDVTVSSLSAAVGLPVPSEDQFNTTKAELITAIRNELKE